ncbi:cytosine permease [Paludisphaera rhizosphaerae]|uniref:cytosine permease n=1 Tax=Paludisphaera rhizosphaerae TaxID=2711216 RepID=UPI0013EBBBEB|nr:cytosine permease [Paludisphaera rhizosphaerae]
MSTETIPTSSPLPDYIASATPNPPANRAPWYSNTAPTFAGIFLWFVFWNSMSGNGLSVGGLLASLGGVVVGALICHFLFYLAPGLLGMKTGLPLYVVGTSTFGAIGGLIMPGFLMGALQFGWLGVNAYGSADALMQGFGGDKNMFYALAVVWTVVAAFVGLKGIQYVAKVATFLPIIPLVVLIVGLAYFGASAFSYKPGVVVEGSSGGMAALFGMIGAIVGFFGTAGAAGVDFGTNSRDANDVKMGGLIGVVVAIILTAGISLLVVAGARATGAIPETENLMTAALNVKLTGGLYKAIMIGLTLASFPGACFSSFIAANSFKTVMPKVNPLVSVGIGTVVSIILAVTGLAANLPSVFGIIGASFGPICGAMTADYILNGYRWSGPRAGFNPAGWVAWAVGFFVGVMPNLHAVAPAIPAVPAAPVAAYIVGFILYYVLYTAGLKTPVLDMPQRIDV